MALAIAGRLAGYLWQADVTSAGSDTNMLQTLAKNVVAYAAKNEEEDNNPLLLTIEE